MPDPEDRTTGSIGKYFINAIINDHQAIKREEAAYEELPAVGSVTDDMLMVHHPNLTAHTTITARSYSHGFRRSTRTRRRSV
jgi:hypothetical protein